MRPEHWVYTIPLRLRSLLRRSQADQDLDDELRDHVERRTLENVAKGIGREEARRQALLEIGGIEKRKEECRDARGTEFIESFLQDVRFAFRVLRKTPVVTAIALLSLALGIGANTAIFSLIDAVMLRMLPVQDPEQLVQIKFRSPASAKVRSAVTNPIWEQVRDHQDAFSGVFAWSPTQFDLADGGEENNIEGAYTSGTYFSVLGVHSAAGRLLSPADDIRGCTGAAVLGYGFWQSRYAGAQSAVGSYIRLNGHECPIVGVAQQGFTGTDLGTPLDVAIPICAEAILDGKDAMLDVRNDWWLMMIGRLKPGMNIDQAEARLKVLSAPLFGAVVPQNWDAKDQDNFRKYTFVEVPAGTGTGGFVGVRQEYSQALEILMATVAIVLLIACANIASFLLARSAARRKEVAVRLSLGASRGRLIRQMLTESFVLSAAGAILGVFFARWAALFLVHFVSPSHNPIFLNLNVDARVLAFTVCTTVACGLLFGVWPAFRATRVSVMSATKEDQTRTADGRSQSAAARWIIASQVALSLVLLVGTGLFIHTFANLMNLDPGFDRNNVLLVQTNIHRANIPESGRATLYGQMLAKLESLPGVVSAGQTWMTPLTGQEWNEDVQVPGYQPPQGVEPLVYLNWVTPGYFGTMRTLFLQGRVFEARDNANSTPVVVVNQLLVNTYFHGQNPIGKHLRFHDNRLLGDKSLEIIGVVQDAKYDSLDQDFLATAYVPLAQVRMVGEESAFEIRTAVNPSSLIPAVRDAITGVNGFASLQFTTLKQQADDSVIQQRILAALSGFFGGLALLLTAIGLYGVMAYAVALRTHEIGIRMALGAQHGSILMLVLLDAVIVLAVGVAAGLFGSIWVTRLVQQLLFGVKPVDPWSIALAIAALACVALLASYTPARRAMRVDPMAALRYE